MDADSYQCAQDNREVILVFSDCYSNRANCEVIKRWPNTDIKYQNDGSEA